MYSATLIVFHLRVHWFSVLYQMFTQMFTCAQCQCIVSDVYLSLHLSELVGHQAHISGSTKRPTLDLANTRYH